MSSVENWPRYDDGEPVEMFVIEATMMWVEAQSRTCERRMTEGNDRPRAISTRTRAAVFQRDGFTCRRCGAAPPEVEIVVDHILPVRKGGGNGRYNLQTLCARCNARKRDHAPDAGDLVVTMEGWE